MTEKISIFDVEISCIKAKEAMMQAIEFMKGDSVNTIELVSMESLMKEHENPEWKKKVSMQDLVLPGSVEILEAAKTDDASVQATISIDRRSSWDCMIYFRVLGRKFLKKAAHAAFFGVLLRAA